MLFRRISKWVGISLVLLLTLSSCVQSGHISKPPGAPIAPNESVITAYVVQYQSAPQRLLTLQILTVETFTGRSASVVSVGQVIEALTKVNLSSTIVGQRIRATARWHGDEWGQQLWIDNIEVLGP